MTSLMVINVSSGVKHSRGAGGTLTPKSKVQCLFATDIEFMRTE